jgi:hypothetical protein
MGSRRAQTYFKPDELATTFVSLNREWRVDGLFRSSEIVLDADTTMEKMRGIVERLRLREGIVNLIHSQGLRLADSTHGRTIRGCLGGIWRIKQPCVRPLSCWRPRTVPAGPHGSVLHQGDHGGDKSAHELDPGQPEIVGRGPLI